MYSTSCYFVVGYLLFIFFEYTGSRLSVLVLFDLMNILGLYGESGLGKFRDAYTYPF